MKETRDHFVARAYLKRFVEKGNKLLTCRKEDGKFIFLSPGKICCERGWDLIKTASDSLWLKKVLEDVEPNINNSIENIVNKQCTIDDRFYIAIYLSIIHTLNPVQLARIVSGLEKLLTYIADINFHNSDDDCIKSMIRDGYSFEDSFKVNVNSDIVKHQLSSMLKHITHYLYTSNWIIIKNISDICFLTSDNPCNFLPLPYGAPIYPKIIPLDSEYLLLICPNYHYKNEDISNDIDKESIQFSLQNSGEIVYIEANYNEVEIFNKYIIGNAERFIILAKDCDKLKNITIQNILVKNSFQTSSIESTNGMYHLTTFRSNLSMEEQKSDWDILKNILLNSRND